MAVLPTGIGPVTGYNIERSLRFNSADSAYLNRTPASSGSRTTWTWSGWVKRAALGTSQYIFQARISDNANDTDKVTFRFTTSNTLILQSQVTTFRETTAVYRDAGAWYHIILTADTSNATANNRFRIYVNGVEQVFSTTNNPTSGLTTAVNSANAHWIGSEQGVASYLSAYLTEVNFIDGQALTPSSFGETDSATGVWKPKAYSGTYGTNGFFLKFADNSGTTSTTLGKDSSGNSNNWTPNNFSVTAGAGNDSMVDSPTLYGTDTGVGGTVRGNYCTLNPLWKGASVVLSNGNLDVSATAVSSRQGVISAIFVSSGKWYFEYTQNTDENSNLTVGIVDLSFNATTNYVGQTATTYGYTAQSNLKYNNNTGTSYGTGSSANGDVLMCAFDLDNGKIYFGKNGTWYGSGDPVTGTNAAFTGISGTYCPAYGHNATASRSTATTFNFGQRAFAYTAPSGFKALCTTNLPTPTIGATSTTQANDYFNTVLYTGNSSTQSITGVGFQPDFVWLKDRTSAYQHCLFDVIRGVHNRLESNTTSAEQNNTASLTAFNSNGFSLGNNVTWNGTGDSYVAWNWNAGGSNATNTSGTITSTVRANTTSGFSIVTYTGTGSNATIGHGLGVAPSMVIVKNRSTTTDWLIYHVSLGATKSIAFDTAAAITSSTRWNDTAPTSTLVSIGTSAGVNGSGNSMVAYCFAPVAGYSAFGSYTGNGAADGPFVYTGFRPRYVLIKRTDVADDWGIFDTARDTYNTATLRLRANDPGAELSTQQIDINSNGFKIRVSNAAFNANTGTYIYAAFAESPFKYSLAR